MLYGEFLVGTNQPDNEWTFSEYKRIEAIYNEDDHMEKATAYKMFREPDEVIQELITNKNRFKAEMIEARSQFKAKSEEADKLRRELGEARAQILRMEVEMNRYKRAAHDLYYVTGTI